MIMTLQEVDDGLRVNLVDSIRDSASLLLWETPIEIRILTSLDLQPAGTKKNSTE